MFETNDNNIIDKNDLMADMDSNTVKELLAARRAIISIFKKTLDEYDEKSPLVEKLNIALAQIQYFPDAEKVQQRDPLLRETPTADELERMFYKFAKIYYSSDVQMILEKAAGASSKDPKQFKASSSAKIMQCELETLRETRTALDTSLSEGEIAAKKAEVTTEATLTAAMLSAP